MSGWFLLFRVLALATTAFPPIYAFHKAEERARDSERRSQEAERKLEQSEDERRHHEGMEYLRKVLEASVRRLFPDENLTFVRANVMVVVGNDLQVLCGWNMEAFRDGKMSLKCGQGVAGSVWKAVKEGSVSDYWRPVYAPKAQLAHRELQSKWLMSDDDIRRTAHILWILSTPILVSSGDNRQFLGVLNLDGVSRRLESMETLEDPDFQIKVVAVAENIGQVIVERGLLPIAVGLTSE
jgi:hypothetical protein